MISLGPVGFSEGQLRGMLDLEKNRRENNEDVRQDKRLVLAETATAIQQDYLKIAQADLGIRQGEYGMKAEEFGWKREDRAKSQEITRGMAQAAQSGGYEGVIDYLKTVDPMTAIKFHAAKLELDAGIMNNDVLKAQSKNKINDAMFESYGLLGKMGMALQAAPEDQRDNMYQTMLPMVKQINPNAPDQLDEKAAGMFMLGIAQATPQNQLFKSSKDVLTSESNLGKLDVDLRSRLARGETAENSPTVRALMATQQSYIDKAQAAKLQQTNMMLKIASTEQQPDKNKLQATEMINKNIASSSKDYLGFMDKYTSIKAQLEVLQKDPNNSAAQGQLGRLMAGAVQNGVLTDKDISETIYSDSAATKVFNKLLPTWTNGELVNLSPNEISNLANTFESTANKKYSRQLLIEKQYTDTATGYSSVVDPKLIRLPSQQYNQLKQLEQKQSAPPQALEMLQKNPELLPAFKAKYGYDPTESK